MQRFLIIEAKKKRIKTQLNSIRITSAYDLNALFNLFICRSELPTQVRRDCRRHQYVR